MSKQNDNGQLPQNVEAEEAVLGALLVDPDAIIRVKQMLEPGDFCVQRHGFVYAAMLALHANGAPADLVTLTNELDTAGHLAQVGGPAFLTGLINSTPTGIHAPYYARIVRHCRIQRDLIAACGAIAKDAYGANGNLPEVVLESRRRIVDIEKLMTNGQEGVSLRDSLGLYFDLLQERVEEKDKPRLELPWPRVAALMPPLGAGDLLGLLANPGAGKTAFLENCAEAWAERGWRVAFFHLELSTPMMLDRRMQRHTGLSIRDLRLGQLNDGDHEKVIGNLTKIEQWPGDIQYIHCPGWSMPQIVAAAQKLHDTRRIDVVIVDYLNKVRISDRGSDMNHAQLRAADVEDLKTFCEVNGIPGLLAAQFDKSAKSARFRTANDARDTGEFGDKINIGVVIDRQTDEDGEMGGDAKFRVVKCNAGQQGSIPMYFHGMRLKFFEADEKKLN